MSEIRTLAVAVLIAGAFSAPLAAQESYLPIVQLEMRGIIIIAHSAPDGPLYTIKNREV